MVHALLALAMIAIATPAVALERGLASYYGGRHHGLKMANGARFDEESNSCAHRRHAFGTVLRVTRRDGRSIACVVRDRGPFIAGRIIDLSLGSARSLGMLGAGVVPVTLEVIR